jgi:hypothetical protein
VQGAKCAFAWNQVQSPLLAGGLGVPDLGRMGTALRLRWLWKQKQGGDTSLQLPHNENLATMAFFRSSIWCSVGSGVSTLFWSDPWLDGQGIAQRAPDLMAIVGMQKRSSRTVQEALHNNVRIHDITGALTILAIVQYLHLRVRIDQVVLKLDIEDSIS